MLKVLNKHPLAALFLKYLLKVLRLKVIYDAMICDVIYDFVKTILKPKIFKLML